MGASLTIASGWLDAPFLAFVFKPLTTCAIIAHAWLRAGDVARRRRWVLAGLVLSLVGDVALLAPRSGFVPGLAAFLLAHLAYAVAFSATTRFAARLAPFVAYGIVTASVLARLWPGLPGALRAPVVAYVCAIGAMSAQAMTYWLEARGTPAAYYARRAAIGAALFMTSDALLAVNRFLTPLPASALLVLATYWLAQWCIASSLAEARSPR